MLLKALKRDLGSIALFIALFLYQPELVFHLYGMLRHRVSKQFIESLSLTKQEIRDLEQAVFLHDIGKIGITLKILNNPKALTDSEYKEIKKHPWIGAEIVRELGYNETIGQAVHQHHERVDGSGYPQKLTADKICKHAKIIALLDSFDVMRRGRIYKKAMTKSQIIEDLKHGAHTLFDKDMTYKLIELIENEL